MKHAGASKPWMTAAHWEQETRDRTQKLRAFTLIELLVVIAIMGLLAAMIFPAMRMVNRAKLISRARGELAQIESFIGSYKIRLGHYPPDNRNPLNHELLAGLNPLYYELEGTVFTSGAFVTKNGTSPRLTPEMISSFFGAGVIGFVNSDRGNTDEGVLASQFLKGLKAGQVAATTVTNPATEMTVGASILVCTVPGPDSNHPPLNNGSPALNPWRYNSSLPTNNASSYDLWADITINGKVVRICNWSSSPLKME